MLPGFCGPDVSTDRLERWSPPTHFGKRYQADLGRSRNVDVYLHATCTALNIDPRNGSVESLTVARPGSEGAFEILAGQYVLAAGSLENARLLLISNDVIGPGVGNLTDNVARYYMSHLSGTLASSQLKPNGAAVVGFERDSDGVYCRRRFWISEDAQTREHLLNTIFYWVRPTNMSTGHRSGLFSSVHLAKVAPVRLDRRDQPER